MVRTESRAATPWIFLATALAIYVGGALLVRGLERYPHPDRVAAAIAFDLTFTVTFLAWLFPVRSGRWPPISLIPVFLLSIGLATRVLPAENRHWLEALRWIAVPLEIGLLGWIALRAARAVRVAKAASAADLDTWDRIRQAARSILWNRTVADILAFEASVVVFAFRPRRPPHVPAGATPFFATRRTPYGPVVVAFSLIILAETVPLHFLLARWSAPLAWTLTALGLYTLVYLLADWRAVHTRPTLLDDEFLTVRTGLRWTIRIPRSAIESIGRRPPSPADERAWGKALRAYVIGGANVWIHLREAVEAEGVYGRRRSTRSIATSVDEPEKLSVALARQPALSNGR
jgi:hypothetical protein